MKNTCRGCVKEKLKRQVCGMLFSRKWMTIHIEREHQSCNNNNNKPIQNEIITSNQQSKTDKNNDNNPKISTYENHAYVVSGPGNVGKTSYTFRMLERIGNQRPTHIITRSPNQYLSYKTSNEIEPMKKYKGSIVIFKDILGARNSSQTGQFFTRGRHENSDVYYISQSCFDLPRRSTRSNSDRLILFKQTLRDLQRMYFDIGAYEMKNDEFKKMCRRDCSERFNYVYIEMTEKKKEIKYRIFNESRHTYFECMCKSEHF